MARTPAALVVKNEVPISPSASVPDTLVLSGLHMTVSGAKTDAGCAAVTTLIPE